MMGIRVKKVLGWGLDDVQTQDGKIVDPRFSKISVINGDYEDRESWTMEGYAQWLEENKQLLLASRNMDQIEPLLESRSTEEFSTHFKWGDEFMLANVFCFTPIRHYKDWYRSDDQIDYHEETYVRGIQINRVDKFEHPIYPYIGHVDDRSGRLINTIYSNAFKHNKTKHLAELCGFESVEACNAHMHPDVPECVRLPLEYANVFRNKKTIYELRPMIYVYWM